MSDTPIFDGLASERDYNRMVDAKPNGKTSSGEGFFARVVGSRTHLSNVNQYDPDPSLDGPLHLIGAQDAQTEVVMVEEDDDEIYIAPSSPVTSLVRSDVVSDTPTHEFPRVEISDWAQGLLRAFAPMMAQEAQKGVGEPQTGFRGLLDRIMSDARAEVARIEDETTRPKGIVLAEIRADSEYLSAQGNWQSCLDLLRENAARDFPRHIPTGVTSSTVDDFVSDDTVIKLIGVEGALPIYTPVEDGDTLGEGRNDRFHDNRSENVVSLVEAAPDEDPTSEYPFSLPKPLFEHTEEHDEE